MMQRTTTKIDFKTVSVALAILLAACGPEYPPDVDGTQSKAQELSPDSTAKDSLSPMTGDRIDWRRIAVTVRSDVRVNFEISPVAVAADESAFAGEITLYDDRGQALQKRPVDPANTSIEIVFVAEPQRAYYFRFEGRQGTARYEIRTRVSRADPCALCLAEERCVDGRCVPPGQCEPECEGGSYCVEGKCVWSCPKGQEWRDDKCQPVGCKTPCKANQLCRQGKCVGKSSGGGEKGGKAVSGDVLSSWATGTGTTLLINVGSQDGIRVGSKGSIVGGGSLVVKKVFPKQCQAYTSVGKDDMASRKKVSIKP